MQPCCSRANGKTYRFMQLWFTFDQKRTHFILKSKRKDIFRDFNTSMFNCGHKFLSDPAGVKKHPAVTRFNNVVSNCRGVNTQCLRNSVFSWLPQQFNLLLMLWRLFVMNVTRWHPFAVPVNVYWCSSVHWQFYSPCQFMGEVGCRGLKEKRNPFIFYPMSAFRNSTLFNIESKKNVLETLPCSLELVWGPFLVINYALKQRNGLVFCSLCVQTRASAF